MIMRGLASEFRKNELNLASSHFGVLLCLSQGVHNLGELAEHLEVSAPTMSNTVGILVRRGWVKRRRDPNDRRVALISLTPEGEDILRQMGKRATDHIEENLADLSDQECKQLVTGLRKLRSSYKRDEGA